MTNQNATPHTVNLEFASPIPAEKTNRGWELQVQGAATVLGEDGQTHTGEIVNLNRVDASQIASKFLTLEYAIPPGVNWDGLAIRFGGVTGKPAGVLAVPYVVTNQEFLVGIFPEKRALFMDGGLLPTVPGGFFDPEDKDAITAIAREFFEETGIEARFIEIPTGQGVKDRAFSVIPVGGGNWDQIFAVKLEYKDLKMDPEFGLVLANQPSASSSKTVGGIGKVRFVNALDHMLHDHDWLSKGAVATVYAAHQRGLLP